MASSPPEVGPLETVVTVRMAGMDDQVIPVVPTETRRGRVMFTTKAGVEQVVGGKLPPEMFDDEKATEEDVGIQSMSAADVTSAAKSKVQVWGVFLKAPHLKEPLPWQVFDTCEKAKHMNRVLQMFLRSALVPFYSSYIVDSLTPNVARDVIGGSIQSPEPMPVGSELSTDPPPPPFEAKNDLAADAQAAAENLKALFKQRPRRS
jgi:hypothetical protein